VLVTVELGYIAGAQPDGLDLQDGTARER